MSRNVLRASGPVTLASGALEIGLLLLLLLLSVRGSSSSGMLTTGRIAYHREGVFFPNDNAL